MNRPFSEAINTIVLKSGEKLTSPPRPGQRLRVDGSSETWVVLLVDAERRVVDLVCTSGLHALRESVPFDSLRVAGKGLAEALSNFLKSA